MAKTDTTMTEAEWEAKFNGPRNRLFEKIFGKTPCPVKDISPKVVIQDKNWERGADFMVNRRPRVYKRMSAAGSHDIATWNEQMQTSGKIVKTVDAAVDSKES